MNQQDLNELTAKWFQETNSVNIDGAIKATQAHAYALGLKRGQENCAELVEALRPDSTQIWMPITFARTALSKFQGAKNG